MVAVFMVKSGRRGSFPVKVDSRDLSRTLDYSPTWSLVWKNGTIAAVVSNVIVGFYRGTNRGYKTRRVKLHDFIKGDIPNCKIVKHRDGDPLNNTRDNLSVCQMYVTDEIRRATRTRKKKLKICLGCIDEYTCDKVAVKRK